MGTAVHVNARFTFDLERGAGDAVAGADEAGRGSLAGPLVAAAVLFDYPSWHDEDFAVLEELNDSKVVAREARATLCAAVLARASRVAVVACSPGTIDRRGLHVCNLGALGDALLALGTTPATVFVDGFALAGCPVAHEGLVGGDGRSAAVAAASVVAKVTRDRLMARMHELYPKYGFDEHVGYATPLHHERIAEYGVCALHRLSFNSVAYQQLGLELEEP